MPGLHPGSPLPLGARVRGDGVNFAVFSRHASALWLDLFDAPTDAAPARSIPLDPTRHRTGDVWHVRVGGIRPGQLYGFRADGPDCPAEGHRFDPRAPLLDPCAAALAPTSQSVPRADGTALLYRGIVVDDDFDWGDDRPPRHAWADTVVYELHVRGFSVHPTSGVRNPGTYRGLGAMIPYLQDLDVTAVELLPVQEFDSRSAQGHNPITGEPLRDFWGYAPVGLFAPKADYAAAGTRGEQTRELKEMVRAFHRAGIEVILDVVFNHTAESDERGPTLSFRGLDNAVYYLLADDKRHYRDLTGTHNTLNVGHPVVADLIVDCLRHWVVELRVDGFRFDLATILGRDVRGNLQADAPLLERIAEDPVLRDVKLIAEPWDAAGGYQLGSFGTPRWAGWNGRFRDDVRRFWRGDAGLVGALATRLGGSSDLYGPSGKSPANSINFVTCHDGFTLNDLVSYARKHNEANGQDNFDGTDESFSANNGVEGETDDPAIEAVRARQVKNFLLTLLVSRGVPMLLAGDEFRRTQRGNNNPYCQDNPTSWVDWSLRERHAGLRRFVAGLLAFRRAHPVLRREAFYTDAEVRWLSPLGTTPAWLDPAVSQLGMLVVEDEGAALFLMFNAAAAPVAFHLPPSPAGPWRRAADTSLPPPDDLAEPGQEEAVPDQTTYLVGPRSSVILVGRRESG